LLEVGGRTSGLAPVTITSGLRHTGPGLSSKEDPDRHHVADVHT
jgi:hypothetical protein